MTFRAFSIGFSAAVLALACGSDDGNNPKDTTGTPVVGNGAGPAVVDVKPETCDDNPLLAGCKPEPVASTGGGGTTTPTQRPPSDEAALARAAAENVLAANCGQCHGPALTPAQAQAGMNYIDDIDKLVETGKILPLNSAGS